MVALIVVIGAVLGLGFLLAEIVALKSRVRALEQTIAQQKIGEAHLPAETAAAPTPPRPSPARSTMRRSRT